MAGFAADSVERLYDTYLECLTLAAAAAAVGGMGSLTAAFLVVHVVVAADTGHLLVVLAICLTFPEHYLGPLNWCLLPSVAACPSHLADLHLLSTALSGRKMVRNALLMATQEHCRVLEFQNGMLFVETSSTERSQRDDLGRWGVKSNPLRQIQAEGFAISFSRRGRQDGVGCQSIQWGGDVQVPFQFAAELGKVGGVITIQAIWSLVGRRCNCVYFEKQSRGK